MFPFSLRRGISSWRMPRPDGHPLHVAGADLARVAETIAMVYRAFEHVGDGFDAAVRMRGEAAAGTFERVVEGKVIEEQEGVVFVAGARGDGALSKTPAPSITSWGSIIWEMVLIVHMRIDDL